MSCDLIMMRRSQPCKEAEKELSRQGYSKCKGPEVAMRRAHLRTRRQQGGDGQVVGKELQVLKSADKGLVITLTQWGASERC